jgi:hypothetical protein
MGLSAFTDGVLTLLLLTRFVKSRATAASPSSVSIVSRLIALTLETVLLTHIVGASMCIIFLASPPARRTQHPLFWILLEIITELYALSILFTINSRNPAKEEPDSFGGGAVGEARSTMIMGQTELDARVEGYQGSTPFGVRMVMPSLEYQGGSMGYIADASEVGTGGNTNTSSGQESADLVTPYMLDEDKHAWPGPGVELSRMDKSGSSNDKDKPPL